MSAQRHYQEFLKKREIDKLRHKPKGVPDKPWRELTAMHVADRLAMPKHCFLSPEDRKYPVCFLAGTETSCTGLNAAKKRASIQKRQDIVELAEKREKHLGCNSEKSAWRQREARIYLDSRKAAAKKQSSKRNSSTRRDSSTKRASSSGRASSARRASVSKRS